MLARPANGSGAVSPVIYRKARELTAASSGSGPDGATPAPFEIRLGHHDGALGVALTGDFDLGASQEFGRVLAELGANGLREVEIDLRSVAFIDSSGLRMLVEVEQAARERGLELRIIRGGTAIERVLRISGLDKVLPLVDA